MSTIRIRITLALACLALLPSLPAILDATPSYHPARVIWFYPSSNIETDYGTPVQISWRIEVAGASNDALQIQIPYVGTFEGRSGTTVIPIQFPIDITLNVVQNGTVTHENVAQRTIGVRPSSYPPNFRTVINDNLFVWAVNESLGQNLETRNGAQTSRWNSIASRLTAHVQDVYDFAHFLQPQGSHVNYDNKAYAYRIWGETQGVDIQAAPGQNERRRRIFNTQRLRLITLYPTIQAFTDTQAGSIFHEIMHAWANRGIPTHPPSRPWGRHWGVSNANGILGGFDPATFEILARTTDLYAAKHVTQCFRGATETCPPRSYSPLELYLAGWAPPNEVPPLWVAYDARFRYAPNTPRLFPNALQTPSGKTIFHAKDIRTYTIRDIRSLLGGSRVPNYPNAQSDFRMITVMLMNPSNPPKVNDLEDISYMLGILQQPTSPDPNHRTFSEVASHRATMRTDGITDTLLGTNRTHVVVHQGTVVARLFTWQ